MVSVKKRTLFFQNVSVNTWIAIFFKLAKGCRKTSEQDLLQIRTWEKSTFSKSSFFRNHAHLYNRNECLEHLEKTFLPIIRKNFCKNWKKTWFSWNNCFFSWKLSSGNVGSFFQNSDRNEIFSLAVRKNCLIKLFFKTIVFPQLVPWHIMWRFDNSFGASCQISKANRSKSVNTK